MNSSVLTELLEVTVAEFRAQGIERLPSEREMASSFGVSRFVVRRALDDLERKGTVTRVRGRAGGAYLTPGAVDDPIPAILFAPNTQKIERDMRTSEGLPNTLRAQGHSHRSEILEEQLQADPPSEITERLRLPAHSAVVNLLRVRFADDLPLSVERLFLSADRFPGLLHHSPIASVYSLLAEKYQTAVEVTEESVDAIGASRHVAKLLRVRVGSPVLVFRHTAVDSSDAPVAATVSIHRADRIRLVLDAKDSDVGQW